MASLSANERPLTKWDELAIKVAKFDVRAAGKAVEVRDIHVQGGSAHEFGRLLTTSLATDPLLISSRASSCSGPIGRTSRVAIEASYGNTPVISMHSAEEDDLSRAAAIYPSPPTLGAGLAKVFTHFGWEKVSHNFIKGSHEGWRIARFLRNSSCTIAICERRCLPAVLRQRRTGLVSVTFPAPTRRKVSKDHCPLCRTEAPGVLKIANEEGVIGPGWVWLGSDWLHSGWSQGGAIPKEIQEKLVGSIGVSLGMMM